MTSNFVRIAAIDQLAPGTGQVRLIQGRQVALFHVNGQFWAVENSCPHRGGPLGEGALEGTVITCPLHGWQFDVTTGDCLEHPNRKIACFPVRVEGDDVLVELPTTPNCANDGRPSQHFLVRFGAMGHVGKFRAPEPVGCHRGDRVVVQSSRGLEIGEVLLTAEPDSALMAGQPDSGVLVREFTEDDAVKERLLRDGQLRAFDACRQLLADRNMPVELVDAEQLFDGQTLIFYFLGDPPPALAHITAELARAYETQVQFRPLGSGLESPCGTGCGSEGGHACGNCGDGDCGAGECGRESHSDSHP
jgi:nitrite reductase (NADH) small subunit/3-phenylpropionate/trans-cinnamate dioxygenase ferredoxin subunit